MLTHERRRAKPEATQAASHKVRAGKLVARALLGAANGHDRADPADSARGVVDPRLVVRRIEQRALDVRAARNGKTARLEGGKLDA